MKIFVLICTKLYDGSVEGVSCLVFTSREDAIKQFKNDYEKVAKELEGIEIDPNYNNNCFASDGDFEEFFYGYAYVRWDIVEKEVCEKENN